MILSDIVSKCGIKCTKCPFSLLVWKKLSTPEEYEQFKKHCHDIIGYAPHKYIEHCLGCQTPRDQRQKGIYIPLTNCLVYECATRNEMPNCAYCSRFPCNYYVVKNIGAEWTREKFEAKQNKPILEEDYLIFIEPFEGLRHLKEIRVLLKPQQIINVKTLAPPILEIEEFPVDLKLSKEEIASFQNLYKIIKEIKESPLGLTDVDTYAQQQYLIERRNIFIRFLWMVGIAGEFANEKGGYLKIEPGTYLKQLGGVKELESSNYLQKTLFKLMNDFGINCDLIITAKDKYGKSGWLKESGKLLKVGWYMTIAFSKKAGGSDTLHALKLYAMKNVEKFGKKAISHFTSIDMSALKK